MQAQVSPLTSQRFRSAVVDRRESHQNCGANFGSSWLFAECIVYPSEWGRSLGRVGVEGTNRPETERNGDC